MLSEDPIKLREIEHLLDKELTAITMHYVRQANEEYWTRAQRVFPLVKVEATMSDAIGTEVKTGDPS
jgi:hypothetical protein